jgi:hypothetical protein
MKKAYVKPTLKALGLLHVVDQARLRTDWPIQEPSVSLAFV